MTDNEFQGQVLGELRSIKEGLWGIPGSGDTGLAGRVREVCDDHLTLRRQFLMLVAFLIGLGVLAGGGLGLSEILKR